MNKRLYYKFIFSPLFVTQGELIKPMTIFDMFRGMPPVIINEVPRPVFTTSAAYLAYSVNNALKCQDEINCRVRMGDLADLALKHNIIPIHFSDRSYNSETLYFDCEFCYDDFPITYKDYLKQYEIVKLKLL